MKKPFTAAQESALQKKRIELLNRTDITPEHRARLEAALSDENPNGLEDFDELLKRAAQPKE